MAVREAASPCCHVRECRILAGASHDQKADHLAFQESGAGEDPPAEPESNGPADPRNCSQRRRAAGPWLCCRRAGPPGRRGRGRAGPARRRTCHGLTGSSPRIVASRVRCVADVTWGSPTGTVRSGLLQKVRCMPWSGHVATPRPLARRTRHELVGPARGRASGFGRGYAPCRGGRCALAGLVRMVRPASRAMRRACHYRPDRHVRYRAPRRTRRRARPCHGRARRQAAGFFPALTSRCVADPCR